MKRKIIALAMAFLLLVNGISGLSFAETKQISDIKIKGNSTVSSATILNKLKMSPGDVFEETALNKELRRLYATGFFNDVFVETEERPEGVVVTFTVVEKPIVSGIEFNGNARINSNRLRK